MKFKISTAPVQGKMSLSSEVSVSVSVPGTVFVFPGQDLSPFIEERIKVPEYTGDQNPIKVQVGPGIIQSGSEVIALRAGKLKFLAQKRYVPLQNDLVIGIITAKLSEYFRVDIGAQTGALLSLANGFEGATKKNRPTWSVGTIIFARIALAHPDLEPELACFDPSGRVPLDLFGELGCGIDTSTSIKSSFNENDKINSEISATSKSTAKTSILLRTSCNFSRSLQNPRTVPLLSNLGRHFAFEVAAGANGRIFLEAENPREAVALAQIIKTSGKEIWKTSEETGIEIEIDIIEKKVQELAKLFGKIK